MDMPNDKQLWNTIASALSLLETEEEIVICSSNATTAISTIYHAVLTVTPESTLTTEELYGIRALILEAIKNKQFFDWEMPTLTGFDINQFEKIAGKLPKE